MLKGKAYVNDLRNEFAFKTDVTERVPATFDEEGIESPKLSPKGEESTDVPRRGVSDWRRRAVPFCAESPTICHGVRPRRARESGATASRRTVRQRHRGLRRVLGLVARRTRLRVEKRLGRRSLVDSRVDVHRPRGYNRAGPSLRPPGGRTESSGLPRSPASRSTNSRTGSASATIRPFSTRTSIPTPGATTRCTARVRRESRSR